MWSSLAQDLRYGVRTLARSPGFTAIAVVTLALGIGLNTTLFTLFDAVALKPLPVRDGRSLMRLERWFASGRLGSAQYVFSSQEYEYLKTHSHSLPELIAVSNPVRVSAVLPSQGTQLSRPIGLVGELVSANYFSQLAPNALLGRTFASGEGSEPGADPVVVVGYRFWQAQLSGDPLAVGKTLMVNGAPFTIVGVAPREFIGTGNPPQIPDFWAPLTMQAQIAPGRDWLNDPLDLEFQLLGHEVPVAASLRGAAELSVLVGQFQSAHPNPLVTAGADPRTTGIFTTRVSMQPATLFGNTEDVRFRAIVTGLMTIVGMVLLIASANVANMLLARAAGRRREIGVRLALGASRGRLVRQLLTESILLALVGGAAGLVVSIWAGDLVWAAVTPFLEGSAFVVPLSPDARVFAYTLVMSIATGVIFGLSPALHASRSDVATTLKDSEMGGGQWTKLRSRELLVGGQVAVSMMFLVSAGLLALGLIRSATAAPGYATKSVYLVPLGFPGDRAQASVRTRGAVDRLIALPAVQGVGIVERPPMMWTWTVPLRGNGIAASAPISALANHVSGSYFQALGIPLARGRTFTRVEEEEAGALVTIVSEATARALWPGADPIGKRVDVALTPDGRWSSLEVVGVAADVRTANLSRPDPAMAYFPVADADLATEWAAIRTRGDSRSAIAEIGAALAPLDARFSAGWVPINLEYDVVRTQKLISRTLSVSAAALALLALLLTAVGIYGVVAFTVSQREREVGIRMALGARAADVARMIVRDGVAPVAAGGAAGLLGSFALSAILRAMLAFPASPDYLYGVGSFDPATFVALSAFLAVIALTATYLPARSATRVDPMVALRRE